MNTRSSKSPWWRIFAGAIAATMLALAPQVFAQDAADDDSDDADDVQEEIVVTGSRIKRDTYSSISPLQIITGQLSREVGLIDAADILQESTASSGQQIDLTFTGFVLDNGPGASTISLRGLGEARTLVLVNGRRLAPFGVEGAPFAPDLNLVPASLVQQYDLLLDGASSVYGSDAIAGVANIILRKDFDGVEIDAYSRVPEHSNGIDHTISAVWGKNFDRGYIAAGVEYETQDRISLNDRPWTAGCDRHNEIDENGQVRSQEQFYTSVYGMDWDDCNLGVLVSRVSVPFAGSIYYTPGFSNGGWANFSESSNFGLIGVDGDGDGQTDISFRDYDFNGKPYTQNGDLIPENSTLNFMLFGEYTFDGEANITPYFETMYAERDFTSNNPGGSIFPTVGALNPYNPCNPAAITGDGVDCGLAFDAQMNNPNFVAQVMNTFGCDPSAGGSCDQTVGAIGAASVVPIVAVQGDRNTTDISGDQLRVVGGVRGDMPFLKAGSLDNWTFDIYASYTQSSATSVRTGIRGDRMELALGNHSTSNTPCENDTGAILAADAAPGCVPVNLFAPSLYPVGDGIGTGDFATQAERDYLFDGRDFATDYEQTVISGYVTGDIFEMPAGAVALGLGFETRNDDIKSLPDEVARDGLLISFFADGGAEGDKDTDELFAEVEIPLLAGQPGFEELTLNMSTRYTKDEIYGSGNTESFKLGWRPVDSLQIRGTYGTSFRAPNLREVFLRAQTGFNNIFDPCFIPDQAIDPISGGYNAALDDREAQVLANCLANGVDPTIANNNGFNTFSTEIQSGGSTTLQAEESEAWSAGFAWDQPFTNAFGLSLGVTYYEIEVTNTIIEPTGQFIVNDCYNSLTGNSVFCSRITRDFSDPTLPTILLLDQGFLNRDKEKARGVDINLTFDDSWTIMDRPIDVGLDITANRNLERSTLFVDDEGNPDADTFLGEFGSPDWNVRTGLRFDYDDFRVTWETRYLSSVKQDSAGVDAFSDINGTSDTCLGPPTDVQCRDFGEASNYFLHHVSAYYYGDRWTIGAGVRNVLDEEPPVVDGTEVLAINNTPIGYGYDINGRTYFINIGLNFGGVE